MGETKKDGWYNAATGFGTAEKDATEHATFLRSVALPLPVCAALLIESDIAGIVAEAPIEAMLRGPIKVKSEDQKGAERLEKWLQSIEIKARFSDAHSWGRAFGGALMVLGVNDGNGDDLTQPLDWSRVRSLDWIQVYDRREAWRETLFSTGAYWGQPALYQINPSCGTSFKVHASRTIRFGGQRTPNQERQALQGWDCSVYERLYPRLRAYDSALKSAELLLKESSIGVFAMKGLLEALGSPDQTTLTNRLQALALGKSIAGVIALDADHGESFVRISAQLTGTLDIINGHLTALSASSRIPKMVLAGTQPSGLNATGDNEIRSWYDQLENQRGEDIAPKMQRVLAIGCLSFGLKPENYSLEFASFWQESPPEKAARRKTEAETDALLFDRGALDAEEIRDRLRADGYALTSDKVRETAPDESQIMPYTDPAAPQTPAPVDTGASKPELTLAPTDIAVVVTVNEARASQGLPAFPEPDGSLTISAYKAKYAATIATASAAEAGDPSLSAAGDPGSSAPVPA